MTPLHGSQALSQGPPRELSYDNKPVDESQPQSMEFTTASPKPKRQYGAKRKKKEGRKEGKLADLLASVVFSRRSYFI